MLEEIKADIKLEISSFDHKLLRVSKKKDNSIVTDMDIYISELFKHKLNSLDSSIHFYSEENLGDFRFPVAILDPIDGTKEFVSQKEREGSGHAIWTARKALKGVDEAIIVFGDSILDIDLKAFIAILGAVFDFVINVPKLLFIRSTFTNLQYQKFMSLPDSIIYWKPLKKIKKKR